MMPRAASTVLGVVLLVVPSTFGNFGGFGRHPCDRESGSAKESCCRSRQGTLGACCSEETQIKLLVDECNTWGDRSCRGSADAICQEPTCQAWASYKDNWFNTCGKCDAACVSVVIGSGIGILLLIGAAIYGCCFCCPCCPVARNRQRFTQRAAAQARHHSAPAPRVAVAQPVHVPIAQAVLASHATQGVPAGGEGYQMGEGVGGVQISGGGGTPPVAPKPHQAAPRSASLCGASRQSASCSDYHAS